MKRVGISNPAGDFYAGIVCPFQEKIEKILVPTPRNFIRLESFGKKRVKQVF